ncbi:hypothetical protein NDU88_003617 [Pleurodeles waltl]|uniref:Uncharacterized protein n=1 Tax=Pleurodeles waltl TaxID=8319 RepID=A0AAV7MSQ9_PLEWA|nr:hypothetical protein NDU88_003617 [Pleurodeles waltl]
MQPLLVRFFGGESTCTKALSELRKALGAQEDASQKSHGSIYFLENVTKDPNTSRLENHTFVAAYSIGDDEYECPRSEHNNLELEMLEKRLESLRESITDLKARIKDAQDPNESSERRENELTPGIQRLQEQLDSLRNEYRKVKNAKHGVRRKIKGKSLFYIIFLVLLMLLFVI